jgi:hypothetical protein
MVFNEYPQGKNKKKINKIMCEFYDRYAIITQLSKRGPIIKNQ